MTDNEIMDLAERVFASSTSIIIQQSDEQDTFVFKLHKLQPPMTRMSLHLNGEIQFDREAHIGESFFALCDTIKMTDK